MASARNPIASDSPSAITPRITGSRHMRWRCIGELTDFVTSTTSPAGVRTATDQTAGPRIITPSSTAWPPYETLISARALSAAGAAGLLETTLEALDPTAGIHQLL